MRIKATLLVAFTALAAFAINPGEVRAQSAVALSGQITSAEEGAMEGVVVSAKRDGSTITISVVTDAQGRFAFPAARLEPGKYTLRARASGFQLGGTPTADVAAGQEAKADLKLTKLRSLSAHLTNAEWLHSMPGTDQQKKFLLDCIGCHTLERIMKSPYDSEALVQVINRMATYYPGTTPLRPQRLAGNFQRMRDRGNVKPITDWLASINLSQQDTWQFPLKTLPRPTGKSTQVIFTEYDLPEAHIQPHDVVMDSKGNVWYSDFGQMFLGKMDPKTGKVTQYPIPITKPGYPQGSLDLEIDRDDNVWLGMMYQAAIVRFDQKTETFKTWSIPKEWDTEGAQFGHLAVNGTHVDGKVWVKNSDGTKIYRLDPRQRPVGGPWRTERPAHQAAHRHLRHPRRHRHQRCLSARFLRRQHRQDRRQDQGDDGLPDAVAELDAAARPRRLRRPRVVRRIPRRPHRHARSEDGADRRVEGADRVERAV